MLLAAAIPEVHKIRKKVTRWQVIESCNESADFWRYAVGVNIIPADTGNPDKNRRKPIGLHLCNNTWSQWKEKPIPKELHEQWKREGFFQKGMAVVCSRAFHLPYEIYLNGIDSDNGVATKLLWKNGLEKKTIVEQHKNTPSKCHIFYYSEKRCMKPRKSSESSINDGKLDPDKTPIIEVQSEGALMFVSSSPHRDGSNYEIIGTKEILNVPVEQLEKMVDDICKKHGMSYLKPEPITASEKVKNLEFKMEGTNRQHDLLSVATTYALKNKGMVDEDDIIQYTKKLNQKLGEPYPEYRAVGIARSAYQYSCNAEDDRTIAIKTELKTNWAILKNPKSTLSQIREARKEIARLQEKLEPDKTKPDDYFDACKSDMISLKSLTDIEKSENAGKTVQVNAVISSNSVAYNVPKEFRARCVNTDQKHMCAGQTPISVTLPCEKTVEFVDIPSEKRDAKMTGMVKNQFTKFCSIQKHSHKTTTLQKFKVRPVMSSLYKKEKEFLDDQGNKWSSYDIFVENNTGMIPMDAGTEVQITGLVIADPKTQKVTLYAHSVKSLDENVFDHSKVKEIRQAFQKRTVSQNMDWITAEFEKYSKIIQRRNVAETGFLTFFSPLYIPFDGASIAGWLKSLIIGDSTVGKSENIRKMITLLLAGQIVSGEMATVAGLAGAAVQAAGGQWFVDFGVLPLQDRKLLAIDGAHMLRQEELAKLAEAERNGKIEIVKASKGEAYARTRQIKIMNPVDDDRSATVPMDSFFYLANSLSNNFHIQSIARIDLACFVCDDVSAEDRNVSGGNPHDPLLESMSELLKLVWSMKYTVHFTDDATKEILKQSTMLEGRFKNETIPLVTNDQKTKLAKISASLACLTCSFNESLDKATVTDEHVRYVSSLVATQYQKAGLDEMAKKSRHGTVDLEMLYEITADISKKIHEPRETSVRILQWLAESGKVTRDELQEKFDLARDNQLKPLLGYLQDAKLVKRNRSGYSVLRYCIEVGRYIVDFSHSSHSSYAKTDTPLNISTTKKEGVSILGALEELERLKMKNFKCTDCNSCWKRTELSIEDIQYEHNKGRVTPHTLQEVGIS